MDELSVEGESFWESFIIRGDKIEDFNDSVGLLRGFLVVFRQRF